MRPTGCFRLAEQGFGQTKTQTCSQKKGRSPEALYSPAFTGQSDEVEHHF